MVGGPELRDDLVVLAAVTPEHVAELRRILGTPEVQSRWGDEAASPRWPWPHCGHGSFGEGLERHNRTTPHARRSYAE